MKMHLVARKKRTNIPQLWQIKRINEPTITKNPTATMMDKDKSTKLMW